MTSRVGLTGEGIVFDFPSEERSLLAQVLPLLAEVDSDPDDPGHRRLNIPAYLDDPEANAEWRRYMGADLEIGREEDRKRFERILSGEGPVVVTEEEAGAFLRVLNEGRLAFAARLGIEVAEDHENVSPMERAALDYLGFVLEDVAVALMGRL